MNWLAILIDWLNPPTPARRPKPVPHPSQVGPIEPFDADDLIRRHNSERMAHGVRPVTLLRTLCTMAEQRASHAADARLTAEHLHDGFTAVLAARDTGENAAMGQADAAAVMVSWMGSPGHKVNILDPAFTTMGAGRSISSDNVCYWYTILAGWGES